MLIDLDEKAEFDAANAITGVTYEDVIAELKFRQSQRIAAAYLNQAKAAKQNGERRFIRDGSNGGEVQFQIQPQFYHYWGQRLGYDCWEDPQFVREMIRDNPEIRIKNHGKTGAVTGAMINNKAADRRLVAGLTGKQPRRITGKRGRWAS